MKQLLTVILGKPAAELVLPKIKPDEYVDVFLKLTMVFNKCTKNAPKEESIVMTNSICDRMLELFPDISDKIEKGRKETLDELE